MIQSPRCNKGLYFLRIVTYIYTSIRQEHEMNTKLTLRLDEDIIIRIKNYATRHQVSLSKFTENIFRQILDSTDNDAHTLTPIVKKYRGILKDNKINETEELTDRLIQKHS